MHDKDRTRQPSLIWTSVKRRVRFVHAKTPAGRDYEDVRLPLGALRLWPSEVIPHAVHGSHPKLRERPGR